MSETLERLAEETMVACMGCAEDGTGKEGNGDKRKYKGYLS